MPAIRSVTRRDLPSLTLDVIPVLRDFAPQFAAPRIIHRQNVHGSSPGGRQPNNPPLIEGEVIRPGMAPWKEQSCDRPEFRINSRQVRSFVQITSVAGKSKIVGLIQAAVLPRNNVFHVMSQFAV